MTRSLDDWATKTVYARDTLYRTADGYVFSPVNPLREDARAAIAGQLARLAKEPGLPLIFDRPVDYIDARCPEPVELAELSAGPGPLAVIAYVFVALIAFVVGLVLGAVFL